MTKKLNHPTAIILDPTRFKKIDPANPVAAYLATLHAGSKATVAGGLYAIIKYWTESADPNIFEFDWGSLTADDVKDILHYLAEKYVPSTMYLYKSSLYRVLEMAVQSGRMDADTFAEIRDITSADIQPQRKRYSYIPPEVFDEFLEGIFNSSKRRARRDLVVFILLYIAGIRKSEIMDLRLEHLVQTNEGTFWIRFPGKTLGKDRLFVIPAEYTKYLEAWVTELSNDPDIHAGVYLIPSTFNLSQLNSQGVYDIVGYWTKGTPLEGVTPADLRKAFLDNRRGLKG